MPMIALWPGKIAAGSQSDHISAFWDVLVTFSDLTDLEVRAGLDGISFLPTLLGQEQPQHDYLYWEFHEQGGKQAVRMGDWKGVKLDVLKENPKTLLYNLAKDPMENEDLSKEHPEIAAKIRNIMESARVEDPEWPFINSK